jgi:hypothetical protein
LGLFQIIAANYDIHRVLYAGSFVHITPSFVFPDVVYVDNDKQANAFFSTPEIMDYIMQRKTYPQTPYIQFHFMDYRDVFDEELASFDLLISQYAGFVGQHCKSYLKKGGLLLANNSHGDAGVAAIDPDYQLVAVFFKRNEKWRISESNLDAYFVPKTQIEVTKQYLEKLQKGIGYKKVANAYLFRKK